MGSKTAKSKAERPAPKVRVRELAEHLWSVISFERCEASGLTYDEAFLKLKELSRNGSVGLCIVTDDAARRIISK